MLQQPAESVQEAVACLLEGGQLVLRQIAGLQAVYLPEYYDAETAICPVSYTHLESIIHRSKSTRSRISAP